MAEVSVAIADDNRQTLNLLGEILEKEDGIHVVGKADNGEDAYNMIVETNPDIVLMDVIKPRLWMLIFGVCIFFGYAVIRNILVYQFGYDYLGDLIHYTKFN